MTGKRAEVLINWMGLIEGYTLKRALADLTQEEFDWEPHQGAWGVRRREECATPNPGGAAGSEWVVDCDWAIAEAADRGEAVEPMTTIGWLLNHFGAAPGLVAELEIVGGSTVPTLDGYQQMWAYDIIPTVDDAVTRFKDGWSAFRKALRTTTDEMLERDYEGHPWQRGDLALSAMLNEVSHHGTQICMVRDLFANR
ncbi:MAG TPA: DinB family protein [Acidimicrobiales bacterium]|nr:DinB family protein [Acidimicrobiales bacterium]